MQENPSFKYQYQHLCMQSHFHNEGKLFHSISETSANLPIWRQQNWDQDSSEFVLTSG